MLGDSEGRLRAASGDRLLGTGCVVGTDSWARAWGWLARDRACARRKAQEGSGFRAAREGLGVFAFNARSGPIPLALLGCVGDICVWGQAAGSLWGTGYGVGHTGVTLGTGCWETLGTGCWGREVAPRDRLWWFRSSAALHSLWLTDGGLSNGGSIREFHWQTRGPVPDTSE